MLGCRLSWGLHKKASTPHAKLILLLQPNLPRALISAPRPKKTYPPPGASPVAAPVLVAVVIYVQALRLKAGRTGWSFGGFPLQWVTACCSRRSQHFPRPWEAYARKGIAALISPSAFKVALKVSSYLPQLRPCKNTSPNTSP